MATRNGKELLDRDAWSRGALDAIAEAGAGSVTISRLASRLGATRGSFYWHFKDRSEVIAEALELWARETTTDPLPELEAISDPVERLRALLRSVYEQRVDPAELALSSAGDDPLVAPVFARVTGERMAALRRIFKELGFAPQEAADRVWVAYAFYIGHHQLRKNPMIAAEEPPRLERMVGLLTAGLDRTSGQSHRRANGDAS